MPSGDKVFCRITNKEIYDRIGSLEDTNRKEHKEIMEKLDAHILANGEAHEDIKGSVNLVKAVVAGIAAVIAFLGTVLFSHLNK